MAVGSVPRENPTSIWSSPGPGRIQVKPCVLIALNAADLGRERELCESGLQVNVRVLVVLGRGWPGALRASGLQVMQLLSVRGWNPEIDPNGPTICMAVSPFFRFAIVMNFAENQKWPGKRSRRA